jgi:Flp pilus assembly protein TadG
MKRMRLSPLLQQRLAQSQSGTVVVVLVIAFFAFLLLASLVMDFGQRYITRQTLQKYVDASALAGALDLTDASLAKSKAAEFYALNLSTTQPPTPQPITTATKSLSDSSTYRVGSDTITVTTPYVRPGSTIPPVNLVNVKATRTVNLFFTRLIGLNSIQVSASATAWKTTVSAAGIIVLDPTGAKALQMSGGSSITLSNGVVQVNSRNEKAFDISGGQSAVTAQKISISGNYNASGGSQDNLTPKPLTYQPPVPDPLANLPTPTGNGQPVYPGRHISSTTATLSPGVYNDEVVISGTSVVQLNPGLYVFRGGIELSGGSSISGQGITLFSEGPMTFSGTSVINLSPPDGGTYAGITMFQARGNTDKAVLSGGSGSVLAGTYYFPDTDQLELSGGSHLKLGRVITWRMLLSGASYEEGPTTSASASGIQLTD